MGFIKSQLKGDVYVWAVFFVLALISMVCSFSSSSFLAFRSEVFYAPIMRHMSHLLIGFLIIIIVSNLPVLVFKKTSKLALLVAVVTLVAVQFVDSSSGGAHRQILGFQPSEIGKYASVTLCAVFLNQGRTSEAIGITIEKLIAAIAIPVGLSLMIVFDNLSTAVLLLATTVCMVYCSGISKKVFFKYLVIPAVGFGMLFLAAIMFLPKEYIKIDRLLTWRGRIERAIDGEELVKQKIDDKNRQAIFGQMAVARGGVLGNPFNSQMRDFLPLAFSDFIYSMVIEEWGLAGGILVILLYLVLLIRVSIIFSRCNNLYSGLLMLGLTVSIVLQALVNMSVGVNLIPVTGQPLPLISFGGSSILMTCFYFGIIQSVSSRVGFGQEGLGTDKIIDMIIDEDEDDVTGYEDYEHYEESSIERDEVLVEEEENVEKKENEGSQGPAMGEDSEEKDNTENKKLEEEKVPLYPF